MRTSHSNMFIMNTIMIMSMMMIMTVMTSVICMTTLRMSQSLYKMSHYIFLI